MKSNLAGEIDESVAKALTDLGRSAAWRTYSGQQQAHLAEQLEAQTGCQHIGLACSGTAALETLLRACRLAPESEVLLAGYDYPGNFAAIQRSGARPALVDVEPTGWNLALQCLDRVYTPRCRVLIASHLHGQLQPIDALQHWCREKQIWLIQDACQALGASPGGRPIAQYGDATVLSFGGSKVISAGRGGDWVTNNAELAQQARIAAGVGSGTYELSELQACAILAQLPYLDRITQHCRAYFSRQAAILNSSCPTISAPWLTGIDETAFYQAGWLLPDRVGNRLENIQSAAKKQAALADIEGMTADPLSATILPVGSSPAQQVLSELSQSQHAAHERVGIGSGFPGYHRRSSRRCRIDSPLHGTALVARTTLTVHYRAALNELPVADVIAKLVRSH